MGVFSELHEIGEEGMLLQSVLDGFILFGAMTATIIVSAVLASVSDAGLLAYFVLPTLVYGFVAYWILQWHHHQGFLPSIKIRQEYLGIATLVMLGLAFLTNLALFGTFTLPSVGVVGVILFFLIPTWVVDDV